MSLGRILIVDDNPANLKLLGDVLLQQGYQVRSFKRGRLALAAALADPPDLILLDIDMPEMNGYEVCERLKSSPSISDIPVIFLSALNETEDKVKAFESGGVDYVSKPFRWEEVRARVETHLKLRQVRQELAQQNRHLEEMVAARTRELGEANERLTILDHSKNEFLNLISHEFRTPLNGVLGVGQIILGEMDSTAQNSELREMFEVSRRRILSILDDALLLTEIDVSRERFRSGPIFLSAALNLAIEKTAGFAESCRVTLPPASAGQDLVLAVEDLLVKALQSLLETAVKFSKEGETVLMARDADSDSIKVTIESRGRTIPSPAMVKFFDLFSINESSTCGIDLGLGPAVAYRILSLFGASVSIANLDPPGVRLNISLKDVGAKVKGGWFDGPSKK